MWGCDEKELMNTNQIDSKAEGQQRITIHPGGRQQQARSTGRTLVNDSKQALASPPFGSAEQNTRSPEELKCLVETLERICGGCISYLTAI